jgi:hypothetical protein
LSRADFWCRVLGWLQLLAGLGFAALVLFLWRLVRDIFMIDDVPALSFLVWVFVVLTALPTFFSGLFTVVFANVVEQAREGLRGQQKILLRVVMALAGLSSAGVVGFAGLSIPPVSILALLGIASTAIAIMGPDWTADLFSPKEP